MASPDRRTVAIVGASKQRRTFGNRAVRAYRAQGWDVYPVHPAAAEIEGLRAYRSVEDIPVALDRVSVYLPPPVTLTVLDAIARKGTHEFFLNPGAEDDAVVARAGALGLVPILACSIVDIGRSPDDVD
jgi:predicted CoA-binding protein